MEVVTSNKGGQKIALDGYLYVKKRALKSYIWWSCVCRKRMKCRGTIKTSLSVENPVTGLPHNHDPDPAAVKISVEIAKAKVMLKGVARDSRENPSQIIAKTQSDLPKDFRLLFPKSETVRKIIQHERSKVRSQLKCSLQDWFASQRVDGMRGSNDKYEEKQLVNESSHGVTIVNETMKRKVEESTDIKKDDCNFKKRMLENTDPESETNSEIQNEMEPHVDFNETFEATLESKKTSYSQSSESKSIIPTQGSSVGVITSDKGGQKIVLDGYLYVKKCTLESCISWSCVRCKSMKCRGTIKTSLTVENPVIGFPHNHDPDLAAVEIAKAKDTLKGFARSTKEKPAQIVAKTLSCSPEDFKSLFPKRKTVRKIIQHERAKVQSQEKCCLQDRVNHN